MSRNNNKNFRTVKKELHIINDRIRFDRIRLIGDDIDGEIMSISEARKLAEEKQLDLMLVTDKGNPPVVRICDYQKFLYQEKKKKKEQEQKQKVSNKDLKEIRFTPNISQHDIEVKKKKIQKFLEDGHKVKLDVRKIFGRGDRLNHLKETSEKILLTITVDLEKVGKPDGLPQFSNRNMVMVLSPKK